MNVKLQIITFKRWLHSRGIYEDGNWDWWDSWQDDIDSTWNYRENFEKLIRRYHGVMRGGNDRFLKDFYPDPEEHPTDEEIEYWIKHREEELENEDIDIESLTGQRERPIGITSYYSREEKEMIKKLALLKNQSLSTFIKEIILNHLKK